MARFSRFPIPGFTERLYDAARMGNLKQIKSLLEEAPFALNGRNARGWTALSRACSEDQQQAVETLLAAGADPDATNANGSTARQHTRNEEILKMFEQLPATRDFPHPDARRIDARSFGRLAKP